MLKRIFIWLAILGTAAGSLYGFETFRLPCRTALTYTLGTFDDRFGITRDDFQLAIAEAEKPWEAALGRELFQFDTGATFPVNLIFDERQERTLESQKLEDAFETVQNKQATVQEQYAANVATLAKQRQAYNVRVAAFERSLGQYNERVAAWNQSDRLDKAERNALQDEAERLQKEERAIEALRGKVNTLVARVNQYAREEQQVVEHFNGQLKTFTDMYGTGGAFDQGVYDGTGINIYQFDDREHLRMVLVHELGHALGIGHVENPKSIMYPMMGEQDIENLALSVEDHSALAEVCSVTAWELLKRDLRQVKTLLSTRLDMESYLR